MARPSFKEARSIASASVDCPLNLSRHGHCHDAGRRERKAAKEHDEACDCQAEPKNRRAIHHELCDDSERNRACAQECSAARVAHEPLAAAPPKCGAPVGRRWTTSGPRTHRSACPSPADALRREVRRSEDTQPWWALSRRRTCSWEFAACRACVGEEERRRREERGVGSRERVSYTPAVLSRYRTRSARTLLTAFSSASLRIFASNCLRNDRLGT